jgi:ribonuclease P protein component
VHRRHRLSRSRDFDAVYRHGRSVSTRFLTLYWFPRDEGADAGARLGLSVPKKAVGSAVARNRIKRRLRELWRARLESLPADRDYVLLVRPGLAEAAEERGVDWLGERIDEVLGKAQAG